MNKQQLIEKAVIDWQGEFKADCDIVYEYSGPKSYAACAKSYLGGRECLFTREEFNVEADRMRGKPDWKDAPDWACWLAQSNDGRWHWYPYCVDEPTMSSKCFMNKARALCAVASEGRMIGDWRNTLEKRPEQKVETVGEAISIAMTNAANKMASDLRDVVNSAAPAKPWFEAGEFPAAGTECEYTIGDNFGGYKQCCFVGFNSRGSLVIELLDGNLKCFHKHQIKLRPLKTEREKAIDAACSTVKDGNQHLSGIFGQLYDAGLLRLPEQK